MHIVGFLSQWKLYLDGIESDIARGGGKDVGLGTKLDPALLEKVRFKDDVEDRTTDVPLRPLIHSWAYPSLCALC